MFTGFIYSARLGITACTELADDRIKSEVVLQPRAALFYKQERVVKLGSKKF